jgi:molybdate transport system substrate-binding protein
MTGVAKSNRVAKHILCDVSETALLSHFPGLGYTQEHSAASVWIERRGHMMLAGVRAVGLALLLSAPIPQTSVSAAEIKVLGAVAMRPPLDVLAQEFERTTSHKITIAYATAGVLKNHIQDGEFGDLTILPKPVFEALLTQGKIVSVGSAIFARSTVGVSVRAGAPKPDISSIESFKQSLLAAKSIVYSDPAGGAASGVHFARVLESLGITEDIKPKTKLTKVPGPGPGEVVAEGEAEIAVSQTVDLIRVVGADYVGPLPPALQNTTDFVFFAGILTGAKEADAAKSFIQYLRSPAAARVIKTEGLEAGE